MINFEYARNVGCADLQGRRIDNCWSNPAIIDQVSSLVADLEEYVKPLTGFTGFKEDLTNVRSSESLNQFEKNWFGEVITIGSFPRRRAAYQWALKF